MYDTDACSEGGTKPFPCPVDASEDTSFGRELSSFSRKIRACRLDEGEAPGVLVSLCDGAASSSAELTDCLTALTKCLSCRIANSALGQSEDCIAFSGFAACDGMF